MAIPEHISDEQATALYRAQFRDGLVGTWVLDNDVNQGWGGHDVFYEGGSGLSVAWEGEEEFDDPFLWKSVEELTIEIHPHPDSVDKECELIYRTIHYDFQVQKDAYGNRYVHLIEIGGPQK